MRCGSDVWRRFAARSSISWIGLATVLLAPAARSQISPSRASPTQEAETTRIELRLPDLEAIPEPFLDRLEAAAQRQLRATRLEVEQRIGAGEVAASVDVLGVLCMLYLGYELTESAQACLVQQAALRPEEGEWPYYLSMLYARGGELEPARASIEAALDLRPGDAPSLLRAGELYWQSDLLTQAEGAYLAVLGGAPPSPGHSSAAHFGLGRIAMSRGDAETAIAHFEAALEGQPAGSLVHYHLGLALRSSGDVERARVELRKSRQQSVVFPDPLARRLAALNVNRQTLFTRGVDALGADQPEAAMEAFGELLERDPDDAEAHYNLARAQIEVGRIDDAELHLRRAVELWPEFFDAHFNLAVLLGRSGREEEAARHLERAVEIDPAHPPTRVLWAGLLAKRGEVERAVAELEAVLTLDAAVTEARFALAAIESGRGEHSRAAQQYERLLELVPQDPRAHLGRARSLVLGGSYESALAALEASRGRFPADVALTDLLARLLATCPDAAIRDGERAVALAERAVTTRLTLEHAETLAMALAETGRFAEAVLWQRRVLRQEEASRGATTPDRRRRLELYEEGRPLRAPWRGADAGPGSEEPREQPYKRKGRRP